MGARSTNLLFLSIGGATAFPYVGVTAIPEKGSAVAWFNTRTDAQVDLETQHAACPVLLGQKWSKIAFSYLILQAGLTFLPKPRS